MKIAGFTFIKNAILYDYPVVESINSVLPLCDAFFVAVGKSDDETLELIKNINSPKIRIIETVWDENLRKGGRVLAAETDKAFDAIPSEYDWCFYLQADEVLPEQDSERLRELMKEHLNNPKVEGFAFNYRHFYGSYDYVGAARRWYRQEVRIIRNNKQIRSYRDAQGFRWSDGRKLRVKVADAYVHHYGWVRNPEKQQDKILNFNKLWHDDQTAQQRTGAEKKYHYDGNIPLIRYEGRHPSSMEKRILAMNWQFETAPEKAHFSWKDRFLKWVEDLTGWRVGEYRNFRV